MDKLDSLILSELMKDAQTSFTALAKKVGVSSYIVKERYRKMRSDGVITKCSITVDLAKAGYQGKAFLMITASPEREKAEIVEALKKIQNIFIITEIIGSFDVLALASIIDLNSVVAIVNEIRRVPGVQKVEIACVENTIFPNPNWGELLSRKMLQH